jgi:hypothetical protein
VNFSNKDGHQVKIEKRGDEIKKKSSTVLNSNSFKRVHASEK